MSYHSLPPLRYDASPDPASPSNPSLSRTHPRLFARPHLRSKPSIIDELLPTPASRPNLIHTNADTIRILRRIGSLGVIVVFLLSVIFLASTDEGSNKSGAGLRKVFEVGSDAGVGGAGWVAQDLETPINETEDMAGPVISGEPESGEYGEAVSGSSSDLVIIDFEKYTMLRTLTPSVLNASDMSNRIIFIGDVHGSFDPLL